MDKKVNKVHKLNIIVVIFIILLLYFQIHQSILIKASQKEEQMNNEIIVIFEKDITKNELIAFITENNLPLQIKNHIGDYALFAVNSPNDLNKVLFSLKRNPLVAVAEVNSKIETCGISDDTYADAQWALNNTGQFIHVSGSDRDKVESIKGIDIDAKNAWKELNSEDRELKEVIVAVIDTGVDYSHPDLEKNMWVNNEEIPGDGIDNDNNGYKDDIYGWDFYNHDDTVCHYQYNKSLERYTASPEDNDDHGTHIAGIIAAEANNDSGVAGAASNVDVKIMSLKINGGPKASGSIANAIEAIKYATMMGADICNLSWGTGKNNEALKQVMKESDMLFVAAAGNTGDNNNQAPVYPASYQLNNLISVTFVDYNGKLTYQSNYGDTSVDIAAPGEDIISTVVGNYISMSGSSMATPYVSAVAAMLYSFDDHLYAANIKKIIVDNMKPIDGLKGYLIHPGIPDAYKTVLAYKELIKDQIKPSLSLTTDYDRDKFIINVQARDTGGAGIRVVKWSYGKQKKSVFHRGTVGTDISGDKVVLSKPGTYTFYASDYAGNEVTKVYEVENDDEPPMIKPSFTVSNDYKYRTISVLVKDSLSDVKRFKYMKGIKEANDFLPADAGIKIELTDGKGTIKVKSDGIYSLYAIDYRGNQRVYLINIKTIKAVGIQFSSDTKTLIQGREYSLAALLEPTNTTDKVTYKSSDAAVASISTSGKITAKKEGTAIITAKTSSGLTATCKIVVIKNN